MPVSEPKMVNKLHPTFVARAFPTDYRLASTLLHLLFTKLKNGCQPFASNAQVHIPLTGSYAYPDVVIVCGELKFSNTNEALPSLDNPANIVEILSESTAEFDRFGNLLATAQHLQLAATHRTKFSLAASKIIDAANL
jgi:hypothetical protein